ncbi:MAG: hypothetical protein ACI8VL_001231, partial [Bacteroidia bacterium]
CPDQKSVLGFSLYLFPTPFSASGGLASEKGCRFNP